MRHRPSKATWRASSPCVLHDGHDETPPIGWHLPGNPVMAQHVCLPRLSQDMTQGRIVLWLKQEGEAVKEGEPLGSIETDKAVMEMQSPGSGILRRVLVGPGQDADVGTPLAILAGAEENIDALLTIPGTPSKTTVAPAPARPAPPQAAGLTPGGGTRQPASPVARPAARGP